MRRMSGVLKVAGGAARGLGERLGSKATRELLFDLAHSEVALGRFLDRVGLVKELKELGS